jgi:DUF4097 and DUF4098 domain-containing protein YvlB
MTRWLRTLPRLRLLPALLALLVVGAGPAWADPDPDEDRDRERRRRGEVRIPVDSDVRVDVEIISGRIEIEGWDEDEVRIRTRGDGVDAIDIDSDADWVSIRGSRAGVGWLPFPISGVEVDLRIDVPKGAEIQAKTINGPIRAKDVEGRLSLHAANGEIDVRGEPVEAHLETVNAGIEFRGKQSRVDARTVNGTIDLRGVSEEVVATTMNGSIRVRGDVIERADLRTLAGSIDLEAELAPGARIYGKSYSGSITLTLPEDTSAQFDVQSFSGGIRNELGSSGAASSRGSPGKRLDFEAGEGEGRVTIDTFSGSVRIRTSD